MTPELSVIVPVYNEAATLADIMRRVAAVLPDAQIIYVDDGSADDSLAILKEHARPTDTVLTKQNGGKGSAVLMGLAHAQGRFTVIQDADLEYDPEEILQLLQKARETGGIVFGSRFLKPNPNLYKRYLLGNKAMTLMVNILYGSRLTDSYTCYKLFPTGLFRTLPLTARGFELEAELCAHPLRAGHRIDELPITYHPRTLEQGKKIRFRDARKGAWTLLRIRLTGR